MFNYLSLPALNSVCQYVICQAIRVAYFDHVVPPKSKKKISSFHHPMNHLSLIKELATSEKTRAHTTHRTCEHEYAGKSQGAIHEVSAAVCVAQDTTLTCLSVFDLSIRAQTLAMWPLTPPGAVWETCRGSKFSWVSWTRRLRFRHQHTLLLFLCLSTVIFFFTSSLVTQTETSLMAGPW